jgi:hypothetical protein
MEKAAEFDYMLLCTSKWMAAKFEYSAERRTGRNSVKRVEQTPSLRAARNLYECKHKMIK